MANTEKYQKETQIRKQIVALEKELNNLSHANTHEQGLKANRIRQKLIILRQKLEKLDSYVQN